MEAARKKRGKGKELMRWVVVGAMIVVMKLMNLVRMNVNK